MLGAGANFGPVQPRSFDLTSIDSPIWLFPASMTHLLPPTNLRKNNTSAPTRRCLPVCISAREKRPPAARTPTPRSPALLAEETSLLIDFGCSSARLVATPARSVATLVVDAPLMQHQMHRRRSPSTLAARDCGRPLVKQYFEWM